MGHFVSRSFSWTGTVDRLFDMHKVINDQKEKGLAGEKGKPIRFNIAMVKELLMQQKDIPREVVENILGQGLLDKLIQEIADRAIQLSQADTLQAACNFYNTSGSAWQQHNH